MTKGYYSILKTNKTLRVVLVLFTLCCVLSARVKAENAKQNGQGIKDVISKALDSAGKSEALNAAISQVVGSNKSDEMGKLNAGADCKKRKNRR